MRRKFFVISLLVFVCGSAGIAQERQWTAHVAGGFTPLLGDVNNYLHNGWNFEGGAGYNFGTMLSATADFMYSGMGISQRVLTASGLTGGGAHLWSLTVNPRLSLKYVGAIRPYVAAGVGYYRLDVHGNQTQSSLGVQSPIFGNRGGLGGSLGLGVDFAIRDTGLKAFTDIRYHYASTGNFPVRMIPIEVGVRW